MTVRQLDRIDEVRGLGWDRLVDPDDLFHSTAWLEIDRAESDIPPRYLLALERGAAVAGAACYPLDEGSEPWPFMRIDRFLALLLERRAGPPGPADEALLARLLPSCVAGGRRMPDTRVLVSPGCPAERAGRLRSTVVEALERAAAERGARTLCFLFVREADAGLRGLLRERGYLEFPSARYAVLPLGPDGFAGYLAGLTSKRRREVRRELRVMRDAGVALAAEPLTPELIADLVPLQLQHSRRYGHAHRPEQLATVLERLAAHCGPAAGAITGRSADGRLRAFCTFVHWGRRLFVRQVGFDYGWKGRLPLYFGVTYYSAIQHAGRVGAAELDYSIEAEATKVSRGCRLLDRYGYVRVLDEALHAPVADVVERVRR